MPRTKRQTDSLLRLYGLIEDVPEERLHMRTIEEEAHCGTAYCALGWAMQNPVLNRRLEKAAGQTVMYASFTRLLDSSTTVFGLSSEDARMLFAAGIAGHGNPHPISKAEVLDNLERARKEEPLLPYYAIVAQDHHDNLGHDGNYTGYVGPCAGGRVYPEKLPL